MRKTPVLILALLSAAMIPAIQQIHASTTTIDGVVSDSMCGKKHMMPGKTDEQCVAECIKARSTYVLVSGNKVYTLAAKPQAIAPFAGKHVHVQGDLKENTLTVTTVQEAKPEMQPGMPM